jgi:DNA-binding transcriptional LysR family regulator
VLEVTASTRSVSFDEDGFDVALRASMALEPSLVRRPLANMRLVAVASPAYLAAHGTPRRVDDLAAHACIRGFARGEVPSSEWPTPKGPIQVSGPLATNEIGLQADAARAGVGIALVPEVIVHASLTSGELVQVLDGEVGVMTSIALVYPERKLLRHVVRAFVDATLAWSAERMASLPADAPCTGPGAAAPKLRIAKAPASPTPTSPRTGTGSRAAARTSL